MRIATVEWKYLFFLFPEGIKLQARGVLFRLEKQMGGRGRSLPPPCIPANGTTPNAPPGGVARRQWLCCPGLFLWIRPHERMAGQTPDAYMIMSRRLFCYKTDRFWIHKGAIGKTTIFTLLLLDSVKVKREPDRNSTLREDLLASFMRLRCATSSDSLQAMSLPFICSWKTSLTIQPRLNIFF